MKSPRWVVLLNAQNIAATHWSSLGRMDAPDSEIMAFAAANDYAVLTKPKRTLVMQTFSLPVAGPGLMQ